MVSSPPDSGRDFFAVSFRVGDIAPPDQAGPGCFLLREEVSEMEIRRPGFLSGMSDRLFETLENVVPTGIRMQYFVVL